MSLFAPTCSCSPKRFWDFVFKWVHAAASTRSIHFLTSTASRAQTRVHGPLASQRPARIDGVGGRSAMSDTTTMRIGLVSGNMGSFAMP